jgi:UDP-glucose 4-epimerase
MTAGTRRRRESALVTGGCGFLGRHLVAGLVRQGYRVRVLDDLTTGRPGASADVELIVGSVLDRTAVTRAAAGVGLVVHLAGLVGMRLATSRARAAYDIATLGTAQVLAATGDCPAVLYSSSAVYGVDGGEPMREDRHINRSIPLHYDGGTEGYATGKWELERLGRQQAAAGRPMLILRPFNVVGDGQSASYGMVLPTFIGQALTGRPMTVFGDGTQRRCFSDVTEATRLALRLLEQPDAWRPGAHPVNLGSASSITIQALAELVRAATGGRSRITHLPYESQFPGRVDVRTRTPDTTRLERLAGRSRWAPVAAVVDELVATARAGGGDRHRGGGTAGAAPPADGEHGPDGGRKAQRPTYVP